MARGDRDIPAEIEPPDDICVPLYVPNHPDYITLAVEHIRRMATAWQFNQERLPEALQVRQVLLTRTWSPFLEAVINGQYCADIQPLEDCFYLPSYHLAYEYIFNSPFTTPLGEDVVGIGRWATWQDIVDYVVPGWIQDLATLVSDVTQIRAGVGYQDNDAFYLPIDPTDLQVPLTPQWFYDQVEALFNFDVPRVFFRLEGEGKIEIEALSQPFGGVAIVVIDRPFSLTTFFQDWLSGDLSGLPGIHTLETNREITQFPPNTDATADIDIDITGPGQHTVEVMYLPRFDLAGGLLGYGGGFRGVTICEGLQVIGPDDSTITGQDIGKVQTGVIKGIVPELDKELAKTETIGTIKGNIIKANDANTGLYGFASDIFDKLDNSNPDSFVTAYLWERRYVDQFRDNELISIPIDQDALAFRLYLQVNSADTAPKYVVCYLNGDYINGNYIAHETATDSDLTTPVIGVANFRNGTSSPHIVATMYDYTVPTIRKTMLSQGYGTDETGSDRRQGGYAFYWTPKQAVNRVDILVQGLNYQIVGIEVHYLTQQSVLKSQDLGIKPPPPPKLDEVPEPIEPPTPPTTYFYSMDDLTDFINVPGSWVVDSGLGNPAPSLSTEVSTAGGGNFQIEFSQAISIRKISFELFALRGSYVIDEIRTIAYDVDGVNFTSSNDASGFMPGTSWTLFEFNYGDVGQLHDRCLVQILSVLDGSGDTFPTIYKIDNLRIEGFIP